MSAVRDEFLIPDPDLAWDGPFPYALLDAALRRAGHAGLAPDAPASEVKDLLFDLMASGSRDQALQTAWNELRVDSTRIAVDFFLYRLSAVALDADDDTLWQADLPVRDLPLDPLLDIGVDLEALSDLFRVEQDIPDPAPPAPSAPPAPLDVGPIDVDVSTLYEGLDE
jgi:hypothetical protein